MNNDAFNWKAWRVGLLLVALTSLLTAGAGLVDPSLTWRGFAAVFCSSMLTSLPLYLYRHPLPTGGPPGANAPSAPDFAGKTPVNSETKTTNS